MRRMTMTNGRSHGLPSLALLLASAFGPFTPDAGAQAPSSGESLLTFEMVRPHISSGTGYSFGALNGAAVLGYERHVRAVGTLVMDLPLATSLGDEGMGAMTGIQSDLTRAERYLPDVTTLQIKAGRSGRAS